MKRTVARLADGRGILYFDSRDDAVRRLDDPRDLPAVSTESVLRWDAAVEEWVVVAGHRQGRTFQPPADQCPLCPSTPERPTEVPSDDYEVVVFENRFPSLSMDASLPDHPGVVLAEPSAVRPGTGRCEVVCFTPDHDASFASLAPQQVRTVMEAWIDRTLELRTLPGVVQVFPFENRGAEIGVTLAHPHGQIYAYPFVPPRTERLLAAERRHVEQTGRHLSDDILAAERADGRRIVAENDAWTAFVPAAARWPFEVHLYPRRRMPDLPALTDDEREAFGPIYVEVLRRLHRGGARQALRARSREASRFVEGMARSRGLDTAGFRGVSPALQARATARWAAANDALAREAWNAPWTSRVPMDAPPPVNEVAALPPVPANEAGMRAVMDDACARFGITLRRGWAARLHGIMDASATAASTAMQHARAFLPGEGAP